MRCLFKSPKSLVLFTVCLQGWKLVVMLWKNLIEAPKIWICLWSPFVAACVIEMYNCKHVFSVCNQLMVTSKICICRLSTRLLTMCLHLSSLCQPLTDWLASEMMWCSLFICIKDGKLRTLIFFMCRLNTSRQFSIFVQALNRKFSKKTEIFEVTFGFL